MNLETAIRQAVDELYNSQVDRNPMYSDGYNDALRHVLEVMEGAVKRLVPETVQKPWVGLTDEEIEECFVITPDQFLKRHIYKRIETKLKEKNT